MANFLRTARLSGIPVKEEEEEKESSVQIFTLNKLIGKEEKREKENKKNVLSLVEKNKNVQGVCQRSKNATVHFPCPVSFLVVTKQTTVNVNWENLVDKVFLGENFLPKGKYLRHCYHLSKALCQQKADRKWTSALEEYRLTVAKVSFHTNTELSISLFHLWTMDFVRSIRSGKREMLNQLKSLN